MSEAQLLHLSFWSLGVKEKLLEFQDSDFEKLTEKTRLSSEFYSKVDFTSSLLGQSSFGH